MNSNWLERVKANIFPVSQEKNNVKKALKEWIYRNNFYDVEIPDETCELCDHPNIRYQFEIYNTINGNILQVGSECINKFDEIGVVDQKGNILSVEAAKRKVNRDKNKLVTEAKVKSVIHSLINLSRVDNDFNIEGFIKHYKENEAFTPNQLFTLMWRLEKFNIKHNKAHFKVTIKKKKDKEQLLGLLDWKLKKIWGCLSNSQKEFYTKNKN
ncbi:hypothetical protein ACE3MS_29925 [Paenibacillus dendritiformis]|uniref:hypothetical protein n=1 Tax=Paenibacillus TaxID=44249 RepID=UPI00365EE989